MRPRGRRRALTGLLLPGLGRPRLRRDRLRLLRLLLLAIAFLLAFGHGSYFIPLNQRVRPGQRSTRSMNGGSIPFGVARTSRASGPGSSLEARRERSVMRIGYTTPSG